MITLEKTCRVTVVHKKSTSEAFKGLAVGDLMHFSIPMSAAGSGGRGTYASYIHCKNIQTGRESKLSFNQIGRTLDSFEWEEVCENPMFAPIPAYKECVGYACRGLTEGELAALMNTGNIIMSNNESDISFHPVHGHWQEDSSCSKCGYESNPWCWTNYCPSCGAKMDGGAKDE